MASLKKLRKEAFAGHASLNKGQRLLGEDVLEDILNETRDCANILKFSSDAGAGGAASEAMVVTGLLASDEVLAVTQRVVNANSLPLLAWNTLAADALTAEWSADPGAGAILDVLVRRPTE